MALFGKQPQFDPQPEPPATPSGSDDTFDSLPKLPKPRTSALITKDLIITGSIEGDGDLQVDGKVEGEITLNGLVNVTQTGLVKGTIKANTVRVAGHIEGEITAHKHLRLEHTGLITGDIVTGSLIVDDGGMLNGRSTMVKEEGAEEEDDVTTSEIPQDLQFGDEYPVV